MTGLGCWVKLVTAVGCGAELGGWAGTGCGLADGVAANGRHNGTLVEDSGTDGNAGWAPARFNTVGLAPKQTKNTEQC